MAQTKSSAGKDSSANLGFEADREMPSGELRLPNGTSPSSTFALPHSNFGPALPGQLFYSTQIPVCLWFDVKRNALEASNDSRLFGSETELSLVA